MAARLFSMMLSFAILACPYTCDGGCCAKSEASAESESGTEAKTACSGCCRNHSTPTDESTDSPDPQSPQRPPSPAAGVNCICAGAIEESNDNSPRSVELYRLVLSTIEAGSAALAIPDVELFRRDRANRPDGEWSGRALRTEISSLLC